MVQAVAARAFAADGDYDVARKAYLALPRYVFPLAGGAWIRLYSFSSMPVLNAQLQSILSLADYAQLNQDPSAAELSETLLQTADTLFDSFDTGAWSLYFARRRRVAPQLPRLRHEPAQADRCFHAEPGMGRARRPLRQLPARAARPQRRRSEATGQEDGADLDLGLEDVARQPHDRRVDVLDDPLARLPHAVLGCARSARGTLRREGLGDRPRRQQGVQGLPAVRPEIASLSLIAMARLSTTWSTSWSAPTARRRSGMSDPAVYNDRREAAEVGRRLKELEEPHRLAQEWRQARADLDAARDDRELRELVPELEQRGGAARGGAPARARRRATPPTRRTSILEVRPGRRRRRGGAVGRRPLPDAHALRGAPRLQGRAARARARTTAAATRT